MTGSKPHDKTQPGATVRQRAESMVRASPADVTAMTAEEIQRLVYELQVHQVELELQNEQLREAQFELSASRDRLADMYDLAPVGYLTLDAAGKVVEANLAAASMLGVDRESLLRARFSDFVTPTSQDAAYLYWQRVFSTADKQLTEVELQSHGGKTMTVRLESISFKDQPGGPSRCRVALVDTTDLMLLRESLVAANENLEERVDTQVQEIRLLANALANLSEGVLITSDHLGWSHSRIIFANQAMREFVAIDNGEIDDRTVQSLLGGLIDTALLDHITEQVAANGSFEGELQYTAADGQQGTIEMSVSPLRDARGEGTHFVMVQRNVTERKRYELSLRDRQERLQAIHDAVMDAIVTIDQNGIVKDCNAAVEQVFGYAPAEILGRNVNMLMSEPHRKEHNGYLHRYLETGEPHIIGTSRELRALHRNGLTFPVTISVSQVDHLGLYTGVIHDTSQVNKLQREVLLAAGEVQWRIGQALHDGPQQTLAGLSLLARGLALDLGRLGSPHAEQAAVLSERLKQANRTIRALAKGLVPVRIGSSGLVMALESLARQISQEYDLECDFQCPDGRIAIEDDYTVDQLYHIAQEAALNAARHASADRISICLDREGRTLSLKVVDNGSGIRQARSERPGLGLHIMPYRAATIGAGLSISDAAGGGTVVECTLVYYGQSNDGQGDADRRETAPGGASGGDGSAG